VKRKLSLLVVVLVGACAALSAPVASAHSRHDGDFHHHPGRHHHHHCPFGTNDSDYCIKPPCGYYCIKPPPPKPCVVPNLNGDTLSEASSALAAANCKVGHIDFERHFPWRFPWGHFYGKPKFSEEVVVASYPTAGTVTTHDAPVALWFAEI
jgi:hypothetical protein